MAAARESLFGCKTEDSSNKDLHPCQPTPRHLTPQTPPCHSSPHLQLTPSTHSRDTRKDECIKHSQENKSQA
eukprot:14439475-Ditylum_brightwellii.AAC.1